MHPESSLVQCLAVSVARPMWPEALQREQQALGSLSSLQALFPGGRPADGCRPIVPVGLQAVVPFRVVLAVQAAVPPPKKPASAPEWSSKPLRHAEPESPEKTNETGMYPRTLGETLERHFSRNCFLWRKESRVLLSPAWS